MPVGRFLQAMLTLQLAATTVAGSFDGRAGAVHEVEGPETPGVWVERERYLMGTLLRVRVEAPTREAGLDAAGAALAEVARLERLMSSWDPGSALATLNRAPVGVPVDVDPELFSLLSTAEAWAEATGRAFDPQVGPLIDVWDLRGEGRIPSEAELAAALEAAGGRGFRLGAAPVGSHAEALSTTVHAPGHRDRNPALHTDTSVPGRRGPAAAAAPGGTMIRRHPAAWLDTGGFGKGAALAAAGRVLAAHGIRRGVLDFGGQLLVLGEPDARFAVAHPADRGVPICLLSLAPGESAATSGASERVVRVGPRELAHIVDPRSGTPVEPWGSVTVVSADPMQADALSTALYVLGPEEGLAWLDARRVEPEPAVLFIELVDGQPRARWNAAMERRLVGPGDAGAQTCLSFDHTHHTDTNPTEGPER